MGGASGCLKVISRASRIQKTWQKVLPRKAARKFLT